MWHRRILTLLFLGGGRRLLDLPLSGIGASPLTHPLSALVHLRLGGLVVAGARSGPVAHLFFRGAFVPLVRFSRAFVVGRKTLRELTFRLRGLLERLVGRGAICGMPWVG
jgi:hypothetical protein